MENILKEQQKNQIHARITSTTKRIEMETGSTITLSEVAMIQMTNSTVSMTLKVMDRVKSKEKNHKESLKSLKRI